MKQYKVIVTEMHSAEYHVDARSKDEAHEKVVLGYEDCVHSCYNETLKDRDDAYIVEMKSNGVKEYGERLKFFEDTK